jgi:hypothetical protein
MTSASDARRDRRWPSGSGTGRGPPPHRQLRRPRVEPRRNVGCYEALRDGVATSATLMVPARGPGRRRRATAARTSGCTSHSTRSGTCTGGDRSPGAVAARRRRRVPPHGRGRVGPRRHGRGPPRAVGPDRAGDPVGLRREPPRHPHGHAAAATRVLRRLPRPRRRVRLPLRLAGASTERVVGFPFRRLAAEEGVVFPDQLLVRRGPARDAIAEIVPSSGRA